MVWKAYVYTRCCPSKENVYKGCQGNLKEDSMTEIVDAKILRAECKMHCTRKPLRTLNFIECELPKEKEFQLRGV